MASITEASHFTCVYMAIVLANYQSKVKEVCLDTSPEMFDGVLCDHWRGKVAAAGIKKIVNHNLMHLHRPFSLLVCGVYAVCIWVAMVMIGPMIGAVIGCLLVYYVWHSTRLTLNIDSFFEDYRSLMANPAVLHLDYEQFYTLLAKNDVRGTLHIFEYDVLRDCLVDESELFIRQTVAASGEHFNAFMEFEDVTERTLYRLAN